MNQQLDTFWSISVSDVFERVHAKAGSCIVRDSGILSRTRSNHGLCRRPARRSGETRACKPDLSCPVVAEDARWGEARNQTCLAARTGLT
jgi:hypothetical protein